MSRRDQHLTDITASERGQKDDPRIEFRGALDEASALCCLIMAKYGEETIPYRCAEEVFKRINTLLTSDYSGERIKSAEYELIGGDVNAISHDPKSYFGVGHRFGKAMENETIAYINLLRVAVRRAERARISAYKESRLDMTEELNAMSSYVYCVICMTRGRIDGDQE